jgi:hypothetical protein
VEGIAGEYESTISLSTYSLGLGWCKSRAVHTSFLVKSFTRPSQESVRHQTAFAKRRGDSKRMRCSARDSGWK